MAPGRGSSFFTTVVGICSIVAMKVKRHRNLSATVLTWQNHCNQLSMNSDPKTLIKSLSYLLRIRTKIECHSYLLKFVIMF